VLHDDTERRRVRINGTKGDITILTRGY